MKSYFSVLGHEGYGKVILSNRQDINIGDIVTFTLCNVCHDCVRCHGGIEQKCKNLTKVTLRCLILNKSKLKYGLNCIKNLLLD